MSRYDKFKTATVGLVSNPICPVYGFTYDDKGHAVIVRKPDFNLLEEVKSHMDEVGIEAVIKFAMSHGMDPNSAFTADGSIYDLASVPETIGEFMEIGENMTKLNGDLVSLASKLGVSVDTLKNLSSIDELVALVNKPAETGGENNG